MIEKTSLMSHDEKKTINLVIWRPRMKNSSLKVAGEEKNLWKKQEREKTSSVSLLFFLEECL